MYVFDRFAKTIFQAKKNKMLKLSRFGAITL
jgi:hypothetical protein